jgi:hypothetical protein
MIPNFNVVSAEYTIDLFCNCPKDVEKLFFVIRRYLYIPHHPSKKHTMIIGCEGYVDWFKKRKENAVYRVGKHWKVYERGPDGLRQWDTKRKSPYWYFKDLDRVRIEFTAKNYYLRKFKIKHLSEFVKNPRFKEILGPRFSFKKFKQTQGLPGEFDQYTAMDMYGNKDSYMEEYRRAKKLGIKNRYQYSIKDKTLGQLIKRIVAEINHVEHKWLKKRKSAKGVRAKKRR